MLKQSTINYCLNNKIVIVPKDHYQYIGLKRAFEKLNFQHAPYDANTAYNFSKFTVSGNLKRYAIEYVGKTGVDRYISSGFQVITANNFFHNNLNDRFNKNKAQVMPSATKAAPKAVDKVKQIEEQLLKQPKIRLNKFLRKNKGNSVKEFIILFLNKLNNEYETIYYEDKKIHTPAGKRRSLGDIFILTKYYHSKATLKEVAQILHSLFNSKEVPNFRSSKCSQIKRRTFYKGASMQSSELLQAEDPDEFGLTVKQWQELLKN